MRVPSFVANQDQRAICHNQIEPFLALLALLGSFVTSKPPGDAHADYIILAGGVPSCMHGGLTGCGFVCFR